MIATLLVVQALINPQFDCDRYYNEGGDRCALVEKVLAQAERIRPGADCYVLQSDYDGDHDVDLLDWGMMQAVGEWHPTTMIWFWRQENCFNETSYSN